MERKNSYGGYNITEPARLFEMIDSLKLCLEMDFGNFANTLEHWIEKVQISVAQSKGVGSETLENNLSNLLLVSSNFKNLLESLDQAKISTISIANSIIESVSDLDTINHLIEEPKQLESHNITLEAVSHDFEIGGLLYGIIYIPHHHFLVTGHNSGYIRLWGKNSLQVVNQFKAHDSPITCMDYLKEKELLFSGSMEGKVKVFHAVNFPILKQIKTLNFERKKVVGILSLIEYNHLLISCKEGYLYVFDLKNLKLIKTLRKHGPLDHNIVYIKEINSIAIACLGNGAVELICPKTFMTLQVIHKKFMIQELKNVQWNPIRKELLVSFAYKIIKVYKFDEEGEPKEDRELFIDKPFSSKIDFVDENHMILSSFSDKLDFIRIKDGQPVKSVQIGFTFSDFLLLKDERKIIIFPYQSSETKVAIVEY